MPSAYISALNRQLLEQKSESARPMLGLSERFCLWFDGVPEISRMRPYSMSELEKALGTQGKYLSPILIKFGWERRRKWATRGQYLRYWAPPGTYD